MSDLSRPTECASWIADWEQEIAARPSMLARWIRKLDDRIAFFAAGIAHCELRQRWYPCWNPQDVKLSLELLRAAHARALEVHAA